MIVDVFGDPIVVADIVLSFAESIGDFDPPFMIRTADFLDDWRRTLD